MRMRETGKQGRKTLSGRLMLKGLGLFKLAAGLVVVASVLFLVPGLRLVAPSLEKMGTSQSQAMPPSEDQLGEKSSTPTKAENANSFEGLTVTNLGVGDFSSLLGDVEKNLGDRWVDAVDANAIDLSVAMPVVGKGGLPHAGSIVEPPQGVRLIVSH